MSLSTGALSLSGVDWTLAGVGVPVTVARTYAGPVPDGEETPVSAFGRGWTWNQAAFLKMYSDYSIAAYASTGEITVFNFVDGGEEAFSQQGFDGDRYITTDLSKGHYEPSGARSTLERISASEYVVTRPGGERAGYNGYRAPWREGQDLRAGHLLYREDSNGNRVSFGYDADGRITTITDATGRTLTITWQGDVISGVAGPLGLKTKYAYDGRQRLTAVTGTDGGVTRYEYDSADRLVKVTDPAGVAMSFSYDSESRVTAVRDAAGVSRFTFAYAREGDDTIATVTDRKQKSWTERYSAAGRLISSVDPLGNSATYTYDDQGNRLTATTPAGTTAWEYDGRSRVVRQTDPAGTVSFTYDDRWDKIASRTAPDGGVTTLEYDEHGNLVRQVDPLGHDVSYEFDDRGLVTVARDGLGHRTVFAYDDWGNPIRITDPTGVVQTFSYDALNRMITRKPAGMAAVSMEYDGAGRLVHETGPQAVAEATRKYDAAG